MRRKSLGFTGRDVLRRHSLDHMIVFGHKTSPDFDQTAADKAKNRIKQALGEIGCDVFIETDQ
jgi:hypothetical protein